MSKKTFLSILSALTLAALFILALWIGTVNLRADLQGIGGTW